MTTGQAVAEPSHSTRVLIRWGMLRRLLCLFALSALLVVTVSAHPHEFVDWGAGLSFASGKPLTVSTVQLVLTWDEIFSALVLSDFPGIAAGTLKPIDLTQLNSTYGLSGSNRAYSLTLTLSGKPLPVNLVLKSAKTDGTNVTLVYEVPLDIPIVTPKTLKVELYDPTYYTDMGIRGKDGAYFVHATVAQKKLVTFRYEQDVAHPYYSGQVLPQVVVFDIGSR